MPGNKTKTKLKLKNPLVGRWIPSDIELIREWAVKKFEKLTDTKEYKKWREYFPVTHTNNQAVAEFMRNAPIIDKIAKEVGLFDSVKALIKAMGTEPDVGMLIVQMNEQTPLPKGKFMDVPAFLFLLNAFLRFPPVFIEDGSPIQIPVPMGCLLTYHMNTPAGFAGFLKNSRVNELFKGILDEYGVWLSGPNSRGSLNAIPRIGWFSDEAMEAMDGKDVFIKTFECQPHLDHWGYASFDAFFTRTLLDGARPLPNPNSPYYITNACENAPFRIETNVSRWNTFWAKKQPYSLQYILDNDKHLDKFVGGTIFQGFLSPHTYHRFHAPVSGKVVSSRVVPGTYFSHPYYMDGTGNYMDAQPYLGHVATRGIIIIDTEIEELGLVAFVPIGMVDVSTVDLELLSGKERVNQGDNIGTFHFGGSSHMIIFEKKANLEFDLQGIEPSPDGTEFLHVNTKLATVLFKTKK